jgi:hypothetical protein
MHMTRSRKRHPHRCAGCESAFEVTYFDDRTDERAQLPLAVADVSCPSCGRKRSVALPFGAERTLEVELDEIAEADEGGGG